MAKRRTSKAARYSELKKLLEDRLQELRAELQDRMRTIRTTPRGMTRASRDDDPDGDDPDVDLRLAQMKSETLTKIGDALGRLDAGTYGNCYECGEEISEARLRALPFAVRCKDCEEARENAEQRARTSSHQSASIVPAFDAA